MNAITRDEHCLGYVVLYGNKSEIDPQVDRINAELTKNGLEEYELEEPTAVVIVTRAAKELERRKENKFYRPLVNDESKKTVAIVRQDIDSVADEIELTQETTGCYNKKTEVFSAAGVDAQEFEELFHWYARRVDGDDIRRMSRSIVDSTNVISLRGGKFVRDAGGVYFVPPSEIDRIESLKNVLENLKIGYVKALRLVDGPAERGDVFSAAVVYFKKQVEEILEAVEKIRERVSALKKYEKLVSEIRSKFDAYALLTDGTGDSGFEEVKSMLDQCEARIRERIAEIEN